MSTRLGAGLLLALGIGLPVLAAPDEKAPAQEDEGKALTRLAKSFNKLESYAMSVHVEGGQAEGEQHRITKHSVNTHYSAVVHGALVKFESPQQAFRARLGAGGAIQNGSRWGGILSTDEGRLMERLVQRPEAVLAECVKLKKLARWVAPDPNRPAPLPIDDDVPTFDEEGDEPAPTGTRERAGKKSDDGAPPLPPDASHHLRIVAPPTIAIEHFTRIQNSGCFAEG